MCAQASGEDCLFHKGLHNLSCQLPGYIIVKLQVTELVWPAGAGAARALPLALGSKWLVGSSWRVGSSLLISLLLKIKDSETG